MQEEITKVANDVQKVMLRFPEFDEVALSVEPVHYGVAGGAGVTALEASLQARSRDGQWQNAGDCADVWSMNQFIDWSAPSRALLRKIGLQSDPIVFSMGEATVDLISQKFAGRVELQSTRGLSSGM
jgi:hypothetical protein